MNPGGIRTDLPYNKQTYPGEKPGDVTYEEAFAVQPFNNYLVSLDLTGAQIYQVLLEQITGANVVGPQTFNKVLSVSKGFTYTYTLNPTPSIVEGSVKINNVPIDKTATYRVSTNNFLADGGDGFPTMGKGTNKFFGGLDIDAFANYLAAHSPYTPGALDRITRLP